jgi:hypothetical protein
MAKKKAAKKASASRSAATKKAAHGAAMSGGGKGAAASRTGGSRSGSKKTTDHDKIRKWAEKRGARPSSVRGTSDDTVGLLRLDFPGYSGDDTLEEISWDDFFAKFDEENLAFLYQEKTTSGRTSRFNKFVSRENAKGRR